MFSWIKGSDTTHVTLPAPGSSTVPESTKFEFTLILLLNDVMMLTTGAVAAITIKIVDATACLSSRATVIANVDLVPAEAAPALLTRRPADQADAGIENAQVEV